MNGSVRRFLVPAALLIALQLLPAARSPAIAPASSAPQPNFILIVTDDQTTEALQAMPHVMKLVERGASFSSAFTSVPLCCPSRATILTGLSAGHTGVWTNGDGDQGPGGWPAFTSSGITHDGDRFQGTGDNEDRTLALYLHRHGYRTGLFGKYLNYYEAGAVTAPPIPKGWDDWHSFVGRNGSYEDYWTSDQGVLTFHGSLDHDYSTDVFGRDARQFLLDPDIQAGATPFFLYFAPFAPHRAVKAGPRDLGTRAPMRFESDAFNEDAVWDKPAYVRATPPITGPMRRHLAVEWNRTFGALADVDRWLGRFERALPAAVWRQTVLIFTSDNGIAWGDHRLTRKGNPYERSIRVPLVFAGPGIQHAAIETLVGNVDLTPTVLDLAGLPRVGGPFDGLSLASVLADGGGPLHRPGVLLESESSPQAPTYCGVRRRRYKYVMYADGFQELYDLRRDPNELSNAAAREPDIALRMRRLARRLCDPAPPSFDPAVWSRTTR